jgi:hypothetical protein
MPFRDERVLPWNYRSGSTLRPNCYRRFLGGVPVRRKTCLRVLNFEMDIQRELKFRTTSLAQILPRIYISASSQWFCMTSRGQRKLMKFRETSDHDWCISGPGA